MSRGRGLCTPTLSIRLIRSPEMSLNLIGYGVKEAGVVTSNCTVDRADIFCPVSASPSGPSGPSCNSSRSPVMGESQVLDTGGGWNRYTHVGSGGPAFQCLRAPGEPHALLLHFLQSVVHGPNLLLWSVEWLPGSAKTQVQSSEAEDRLPAPAKQPRSSARSTSSPRRWLSPRW